LASFVLPFQFNYKRRHRHHHHRRHYESFFRDQTREREAETKRKPRPGSDLIHSIDEIENFNFSFHFISLPIQFADDDYSFSSLFLAKLLIKIVQIKSVRPSVETGGFRNFFNFFNSIRKTKQISKWNRQNVF